MTEKAKGANSTPDMQKVLGQLISSVYLIGVLVLGAYALFFLSSGVSRDPSDWGTMGDYFGGLMNPVVSFATLVVAYAVWKQQREELRHTKVALEDQAKTAEQQRQEQRFFDLLSLYQSTVNSITMVARMSSKSEFPVQYSGKEAIAHFFRSGSEIAQALELLLQYGFYEKKSAERTSHSSGWVDLTPEKFNEASLNQAWNDEETAAFFDHYFRVVFRLLKDSESLLGVQHFRYVKLLRAQLSRHELVLIGLNLWIDEEGKKMIPLASKYGLLKHLPPSRLRNELESAIPPQIFGNGFAKRRAATSALERPPC